jgi:hypothetical protein
MGQKQMYASRMIDVCLALEIRRDTYLETFGSPQPIAKGRVPCFTNDDASSFVTKRSMAHGRHMETQDI